MRLLVLFHVYYHDQVDYFIEKMSNINGCEWDLYVTMNSMVQETADKLSAFKPDTRFIEMENVGYDVWPFIKVMKSTDLNDYDLVLKLHTKSASLLKAHGLRLDGFRWRDELVDSLLKDRRRFGRVLDIFSREPETGIVCSSMLWMDTSGWTAEDGRLLDRELDRIGMTVTDRHFCVGTIFIARVRIFRFLRSDLIKENIFPSVMESHSKGTMAHVYERILSMSANACGYGQKGLASGAFISAYLSMNRCLSPMLRNIFSINREGVEGIKVLRVLGFKFRLA
ncbi:MAG: hypothetical protein IAC23_02610 [Bacteroidetes bacterium]|uniref:Rhamnan synthesis protein F n=1 Tax=Candidatus Cryptobacteroides merdavium TaxID=2840769 RepID=A0A9D9EBA7_9BACT|nr:hypothetical protein [Candidatus Cryptobacteroides merdavium]